jgi:hypothetical protein
MSAPAEYRLAIAAGSTIDFASHVNHKVELEGTLSGRRGGAGGMGAGMSAGTAVTSESSATSATGSSTGQTAPAGASPRATTLKIAHQVTRVAHATTIATADA